MPTSVTGIFARALARPFAGPVGPGSRVTGFTLIEVLVVVVLIGVLSAVALLSVGAVGRQDPTEEEARRLHALLLFASEEALMQGRDMGLRLEPAAYHFLSYDTESFRWERISEDNLFTEHALPEDIYLELFLEDKEVVLDAGRQAEPVRSADSGRGDASEEDPEDTPMEPEPQLLILSSGELSPFQLWLGRRFEDERFLIEGAANGEVTLILPEREDF